MRLVGGGPGDLGLASAGWEGCPTTMEGDAPGTGCRIGTAGDGCADEAARERTKTHCPLGVMYSYSGRGTGGPHKEPGGCCLVLFSGDGSNCPQMGEDDRAGHEVIGRWNTGAELSPGHSAAGDGRLSFDPAKGPKVAGSLRRGGI